MGRPAIDNRRLRRGRDRASVLAVVATGIVFATSIGAQTPTTSGIRLALVMPPAQNLIFEPDVGGVDSRRDVFSAKPSLRLSEPTASSVLGSQGAMVANALPAAALPYLLPAKPSREGTVRTKIEFRPGDSLYSVFSVRGFSQSDLMRILRSGKAAKRLANVYPGEFVTVEATQAGHIHQLEYIFSSEEMVLVQRNGDEGFVADIQRVQSFNDNSPSSSQPTAATAGLTVNIAKPYPDAAETQLTAITSGFAFGPKLAAKAKHSTVQRSATIRPANHRVTVRKGDSLYGIFRLEAYHRVIWCDSSRPASQRER